jgi:CDP-diacylglycerol--glycerol-3-phosphate 3-phosphatidyltransferase
MVPMISGVLKPTVTKIIEPVARLLLRIGLSPNGITILGSIGVVISAGYFYPREEYLLGTMLISLFALSDLFDGTMARISHRGPSTWGGFLDSTLDRITDSAITVSVSIALIKSDDHLSYVALISLVTGLLIPYVRAKAESFNIDCSVGIAERTERLVIVLVGIGFEGLGIPYALAIAFWLLALLGIVTTLQRVAVVHKGLTSS